MNPTVSLFRPRDRQNEKNRSKRARLWIAPLKFVLPLASLTILGMVFFWPQFQGFVSKQQPPKNTKFFQSAKLLENKLQNPRMKSLNQKGLPYYVQAEFAQQSPTQQGELSGELTKPKGKMNLEDGSLLEFAADMGYFHQQNQLLHLVGHVHISTSKGYDFYTHTADFDFSKNVGEGTSPVKGVGPTQETIDAAGFKITEKGDRIHFTGQTHMVLSTK